MFIPLEDYVEKYCPNIKAAWEAEPTMPVSYTHLDVYKRQVLNRVLHQIKAGQFQRNLSM